MNVRFLQRLSLLALVVGFLQMGIVHAEKLTVLMARNLKDPNNITLLTSINDNLDLRTRNWTDKELLALYETMLLADTEAIITGIFKNISGAKLEKALEMRNLLIKFNKSTFNSFPVSMQIAFVSVVQALAQLENAPQQIKDLHNSLKKYKTSLDKVDEAKIL